MKKEDSTMTVYNENRDKNRNMHDEIREQNAKLKNAPLKEKLLYFKDYYLKTTIVILAIAVFFISLLHSMLSGPKDTAFAALFFNDLGDSSDTRLAEEFAGYMEIDTGEHEVYIDASMNYYDTPDMTQEQETEASTETSTEPSTEYAFNSAAMFGYDGYVDIQKSMALIAAKELDVIVGDEEAFAYYSKAECFADITTVLTPKQLEKFKDALYYYTSPETGETYPVGVYVTGAPKLEEYYYYYGDVKPVFGILVNSQNIQNALAFLDYIYTETN